MTELARPSDAPVRGILYICTAAFCFVIMNTMVKHLSATYPVPEIIWARYFFHFLLVLVVFPLRIPTLLVSRRRGLQVLRGLLVLLATLCMFTAMSYLPIADVVAITFVQPLLLTGLSVLLLRERVGPRRWAAVIVGFLGVLIVIRPGFGTAHWAMVLPLGMATFYALYNVTTRMISHQEPPLTSLVYSAIVGTVAITPALPFFWQTPALVDWVWLIGTGVLGGLGHMAVIKAFERAEASAVAPFAYTELIWATTLGFLVFGDFPDAWTFMGAGVIVASGVYVWHRERRRGVAAGEPPT